MEWAKSRRRLNDFISLVVLYAPDRFPKEDDLEDHEQLNLERAFEEINGAMVLVRERITDAAVLARLQQMLDESLNAYRSGEVVKGAHLLQDFRLMAFPELKSRYT